MTTTRQPAGSSQNRLAGLELQQHSHSQEPGSRAEGGEKYNMKRRGEEVM